MWEGGLYRLPFVIINDNISTFCGFIYYTIFAIIYIARR